MRSCRVDGKSPLYHCHRWDCQYCLGKKIYWLREQAVMFSDWLQFEETWFLTFKGFKDATEANDFIKYLIQSEKSRKSTHSAKFEYFYVLSNHNFSGWHIHLLTNRKLHGHADYNEIVGNLKASCLYLVGNLLRSASADYGRVRRYGGSRLLYKQNMKKRFIARRRAYWLIVQMALVQRIINTEISKRYPLPYRANLGYAQITQTLRYYRGRTEELTFRKPRDDLIGEWDGHRNWCQTLVMWVSNFSGVYRHNRSLFRSDNWELKPCLKSQVIRITITRKRNEKPLSMNCRWKSARNVASRTCLPVRGYLSVLLVNGG